MVRDPLDPPDTRVPVGPHARRPTGNAPIRLPTRHTRALRPTDASSGLHPTGDLPPRRPAGDPLDLHPADDPPAPHPVDAPPAPCPAGAPSLRRRPGAAAGPGRSVGRLALFVAALALAIGLVGSGISTAGAAVTPAQVARALERSPVYIDPALDGQISPAAANRLERAVRRSGEEVYVVLVRQEDDGGSGFERSRQFVTQLRSRFRADGIVVTSDDRYLTADERRNGQTVRRPEIQDATVLANFADEGDDAYDRTLLERIERFLADLRQSPQRLAARVAAYERRSEQESRTRTTRQGGDADDGEDESGVPVVVLVLAALGAAAVLVLVLRRRRRGARPADAPLPVVPARVFEHARAAERAELREDADGELLALAALLDEQPVPRGDAAQDAYQRALDAYRAARLRIRQDAPVVDLVGVLVLVDRARGDLAAAAALEAGRGRPAWTPLCTMNPLHGRSARSVRWERGLEVPACAACAAAIRDGRTPEALRDGDRPYFEGDTVWARTGFGAFGDDLVERVSRGD